MNDLDEPLKEARASRLQQERVDRASGLFLAPRESQHAILQAFRAVQVAQTEVPPELFLHSDGIGTKIELAERTNEWKGLGTDLLAMLLDDAIRPGARPLGLSNVLDCRQADPRIIVQLAESLRTAAQQARVPVLGGEVAELGDRVQGYGSQGGWNWCGTVLSQKVPEWNWGGHRLQPGLSLLALKEPGIRCNGLTLAREILRAAHGPAWHTAHGPGRQPWGELLIPPARIYSTPLLEALAREPRLSRQIRAVIHVTGGGISGKLNRTLQPVALGAKLDNLFPAPAIFLELQRLGDIPDQQAYQTWNMGQGMLLAVTEPDEVLSTLSAVGLTARCAGRVCQSSGTQLISRAQHSPGELLAFPFSQTEASGNFR